MTVFHYTLIIIALYNHIISVKVRQWGEHSEETKGIIWFSVMNFMRRKVAAMYSGHGGDTVHHALETHLIANLFEASQNVDNSLRFLRLNASSRKFLSFALCLYFCVHVFFRTLRFRHNYLFLFHISQLKDYCFEQYLLTCLKWLLMIRLLFFFFLLMTLLKVAMFQNFQVFTYLIENSQQV